MPLSFGRKQGSHQINRVNELAQIFEESGLKDILQFERHRHFEISSPEFSKLMFLQNDYRLSSLELYDLKQEPGYFRIHYYANAPTWLVDTLRSWSEFRALGSNDTGTNFDGDALTISIRLAALLSEHA